MAGVDTLQPEATTLPPSVEYRHTAGHVTPYNTGPAPLVRKITEYHVDPAKWTFLPQHERTVDGVLGHNILPDRLCGICGAIAVACPGQACVDVFRARITAYGDRVIEIRDAGALGKGAFATKDIPAGAWLGEYLGEILPHGFPLTNGQAAYAFHVEDRYSVESREFRNWTAFMNHHCDENVEGLEYIYGRRHVMAFRSKRAIDKDEQVFTWYGKGYFERRGMECFCDAVEGGHLPNLHTVATNVAKAVEKSAAPDMSAEIRFSIGNSLQKNK